MGTPASPSGRASAASGSATHWKHDAYVGYSIHCPNPAVKKRVRQALAANTDTRANVMTCTEFSDFLFLKPEKGMNMGAFDTWRSRNGLRAFSVCPHTDEATAIEGLSVSMRPTSRKKMFACSTPRGRRASAATPHHGGTACARSLSDRGRGFGRWISSRAEL